MGDFATSILLVLVGLFVGIIVMFIFNYLKVTLASKKADSILDKAKKEAEKIKRDFLLEGKEELHNHKLEVDKEIKEKKNEIREVEERLLQRETNIDRRDQILQNRELMLEEREENLANKQKEIQLEQAKVEEIKQNQLEMLEKISKISEEEARNIILQKVEDMMSLEISNYIREKEAEAKISADRIAKSFLVSSMQRYAGDVSNEQTVTVVTLPNDDMKGRIIGREGRNIRTIEAVTGVDLIIDDTPEAIVLSSFDPLRREIAKVTIETLIKDGRIHPARIEEVYAKTNDDFKTRIREYGENALFELGITKVDPELVMLLGKLHFRTSYGQNVLQHSVEVAHLTGLMASELGENVAIAKRAALFHDIGKAIDHEVEGTHVELGSNIAKKYRESDYVINAIESHHGDTEPTSVISELVAIADTLSASRPGARNDSLENYIKRLKELEEIASHIPGVDKSYAMQAGRELRVMVKPKEIDDAASYKLARDIKNKIESELQYPGTIKITVIREVRAIEEAK